MLFEVEAILFDSDGVLVDSHAMVETAWRRIAAQYSLDIDVLLAELAGVRAIDTLSKYLSGESLHQAIADLERLEVDTADGTIALPGAVELVSALVGSPYAFVTSASSELAIARWAGAGIPLAGTLITADHVSRGKPDPEPFVRAAERLGVLPGRCVVFEDSPSGGQAGISAGATVIAVGAAPWPFEPAARVPNLAAVSVVSTGSTTVLEL